MRNNKEMIRKMEEWLLDQNENVVNDTIANSNVLDDDAAASSNMFNDDGPAN